MVDLKAYSSSNLLSFAYLSVTKTIKYTNGNGNKNLKSILVIQSVFCQSTCPNSTTIQHEKINLNYDFLP